MNYFYNSVRVYQGRGCLSELPEACKEALQNEMNSGILLLVWDKSVLEQKGFQKLMEEFPNVVVEECSVSNPEIEDLFAIYQKTLRFHIELVIAVGGGSILDLGKSLCMIRDEEIAEAYEMIEV